MRLPPRPEPPVPCPLDRRRGQVGAEGEEGPAPELPRAHSARARSPVLEAGGTCEPYPQPWLTGCGSRESGAQVRLLAHVLHHIGDPVFPMLSPGNGYRSSRGTISDPPQRSERGLSSYVSTKLFNLASIFFTVAAEPRPANSSMALPMTPKGNLTSSMNVKTLPVGVACTLHVCS